MKPCPYWAQSACGIFRGLKKVTPSFGSLGTKYWISYGDRRMGVLINVRAIQVNWLGSSHKSFWHQIWQEIFFREMKTWSDCHRVLWGVVGWGQFEGVKRGWMDHSSRVNCFDKFVAPKLFQHVIWVGALAPVGLVHLFTVAATFDCKNTTSRVTAENFSAGVLPDEFLSSFTNVC